MRSTILLVFFGLTQPAFAGSFLRTCYNYQQAGHSFATEMITGAVSNVTGDRCSQIKENHFFFQQILAEDSNPLLLDDEWQNCWYIGALNSGLEIVGSLSDDCADGLVSEPEKTSCDIELDLDFCKADLSNKDITRIRKKILLSSSEPEACLAFFGEKIEEFVKGNSCEN